MSSSVWQVLIDMPVISKIGQKDWRVRCVIWSIYSVLLIGSVSMIYPLMLMVSGSVKSSTDFYQITPIPRYFFDDDVLWAKYLESKYSEIFEAEKALFEPVGHWRKIRPRVIDREQEERAQQFITFRAQSDWLLDWYQPGHMSLGQNERKCLEVLQKRYGSIVAYSDAVGVRYKSWSQVETPQTPFEARYYLFPQGVIYSLLDEVKQSMPVADRFVINLDGVFWNSYLRPRWATIQQYNQAHGTDFSNYQQVLLRRAAPVSGQARDDWEDFVRNELNLAYVRIDPATGPAWRAFLDKHYDGDIGPLNRHWQTSFATFDEIPLMKRIRGTSRVYLDYARFVTDKKLCPLEVLSVHGIRQGFEEFLAESTGVPLSQVEHAALPIAAADRLDFGQQTGSLRWEFIRRNYIKVLDYILLHGNGIRNTLIYCGLMIGVTLTINPLAAYALSRYKPPSTYKVLLFCMLTMAFPAEVTMIPAFLLLKHFPLIGLALAIGVGLLSAWLIGKLRPASGDALRGILGGAVGIVAGFFLLPLIFGANSVNVSLLNTFWALVLPAAANGYSIFLLKGFFDSLPRELYEAADIDGAGEWTKFWTITMSLSKPILAVLALSAFTAAYSEFMMALVIIPDPEMWTLMVWLFQLQSIADPYVVYASIVIAAIPTLLIFLFCQNIIMRGIVVPVEK